MSTRLKAVDALNQFHFESHSSSRPYFMQGSTAFDSSPLIDEFKRLSSLTGRDAEAHAERLKAGMAPDGSMPADERTNPRRGSTMAVALIDRGSLLAQARLEEEAWRGRVEGMVVGTIVGALGGGSAVALHGPLFAAVGAACSVM